VRSSKSAVYDAPPVSGRVVEFVNSPDGKPVCTVENLDTLTGLAISYVESDDGSTWAPIANTSASIDPKKSNTQEITSARARIALMAQGNVSFQLTVERQVNGSPTSLGTA
jgi:hypothetical protein